MKIGIVGYGHVGKAMHALFKDAEVFDEPLNIGTKEKINKCEIAFVCVPTPSMQDGSCDTSIVENVISWLNVSVIVLRSTVKVGFTDEMMEKYQKEIVFQPEYYGETVAHPFAELSDRKWLAFGGNPKGIDMAIKAYQTVMNSNVQILQYGAKEVEFAKYMENAYLATKVTFCNEMYDIAKGLDVNYNRAREVWVADPRIGTSHTFVYENNRGFGGSCLPKDIAAIINQADEIGANADFLKSVVRRNVVFKET